MTRRYYAEFSQLKHHGYFDQQQTLTSPTISKGVYSLSANQNTAIKHLAFFPEFLQKQINHTSPKQPTSIHKATLFIVGNKVKEENQCCEMLTILFGFLLIFPFLFLCCDWWKKIVYPKYELSQDAYIATASFLQSAPTLTHLVLQVVDNSFNKTKANILFQALKNKKMTNFTLLNHAQGLNYNQTEYEQFEQNALSLKSLPFDTKIEWDGKKA